jgi:hypothetical protein
MKVVAITSFIAEGFDASRGNVYDIADKLAKSWIEAGLVAKGEKLPDAPEFADATTVTAPDAPIVTDSNDGDDEADGGEAVEGEQGDNETETDEIDEDADDAGEVEDEPKTDVKNNEKKGK